MDGTETREPPASGAPTGGRATGRRRKHNLLLRGVSALGALGLIYFCLYWDVTRSSGWAWAFLVAGFSLLCLREFYRLAADCDFRPFSLFGYLTGPLWILCQEWDLSGGATAWGFSASWSALCFAAAGSMLLQLTRKTNANALGDVSLTLFGMLYCCVMPGLTLHFRHMQFGPGGWPMHGIEFAVVCIFVSKVSDVGALLTGSRWGKTKLIPRLSPGKTWEGAIGGLLFSIGLLQFMAFTAPWMALASLGLGKMILLSVLLAAGGLAGDLVESAFKRNSRRKDAGAGVPGFGGMLDLTDSLMIASPVMYFFLVFNGAEYV